MHSIRIVVILGFLSPMVATAAEAPSTPPAVRQPPYVILSWDTTGDFGPQTSGTKTDGWQEALDFCVKEAKDLYVQGGFGGRKPIYHIRDTIRFPPAQDLRVDGGVHVLNWEGPLDKEMLVLDSAMNCEYHLGLLVYGGHKAGLAVRPEKDVPIDGFPAWVETQVVCQGIADPHPFQAGERKAGTGLLLDGSKVSIVHCDFFFSSVLNFHTCIELAGSVSFNEIRVPHLHTNSHRGTLMTVGDRAFGNRFLCGVGVDQGASEVTGIVLSGRRNGFELGRRGSNKPFPPHQTLILTEAAEGNQINIVDSEGNDPSELVTDRATVPTNQITWAGPNLPVRKLDTVGTDFTWTQRLYPAVLRWSGGKVQSATFTRLGETLDLGTATDREMLLGVGDQLRLRADPPPTVHVLPVKVR